MDGEGEGVWMVRERECGWEGEGVWMVRERECGSEEGEGVWW